MGDMETVHREAAHVRMDTQEIVAKVWNLLTNRNLKKILMCLESLPERKIRLQK